MNCAFIQVKGSQFGRQEIQYWNWILGIMESINIFYFLIKKEPMTRVEKEAIQGKFRITTFISSTVVKRYKNQSLSCLYRICITENKLSNWNFRAIFVKHLKIIIWKETFNLLVFRSCQGNKINSIQLKKKCKCKIGNLSNFIVNIF